MTRSYIVAFSVPATETRRARTGSYSYDALFFMYEDIVFNHAEDPIRGEVCNIYRESPNGLPEGDPLLTVRWNADGSRQESGPLALPPRAQNCLPCPACSSETGICFHRVTPAQSDIYRGGRRIGEIATLADEGAPDGPLYSVLLHTDPIARFRVSSPSELLPRVVERVNSHPHSA